VMRQSGLVRFPARLVALAEEVTGEEEKREMVQADFAPVDCESHSRRNRSHRGDGRRVRHADQRGGGG